MEYSVLYDKYEILLNKLKEIIDQSQTRVLSDEPDEMFSNNINFFVKLYLINICTCLEAYLQDIAFEYSKRVTGRLKKAKIPHNFLYGKLSKNIKDRELSYKVASYKYDKKELSEKLSGNPYKTIKAFRLIGIDLNSSEGFLEHKDLVESIVNKRNNIIHHNDDASDISFSDLMLNVDVFLEYMQSIKKLLNTEENT